MTRFSKLSLLLGIVALNAQLCPCPALADTDDGDNPHAQHAVAADTDTAGCHGSDSRDDCDMATGDAPDLSVSKKGERTPADTPALAPPAASVYLPDLAPHGKAKPPPAQRQQTRRDPVALSDRLLD